MHALKLKYKCEESYVNMIGVFESWKVYLIIKKVTTYAYKDSN